MIHVGLNKSLCSSLNECVHGSKMQFSVLKRHCLSFSKNVSFNKCSVSFLKNKNPILLDLKRNFKAEFMCTGAVN